MTLSGFSTIEGPIESSLYFGQGRGKGKVRNLKNYRVYKNGHAKSRSTLYFQDYHSTREQDGTIESCLYFRQERGKERSKLGGGGVKSEF